jgi:hypothetical protein
MQAALHFHRAAVRQRQLDASPAKAAWLKSP